MPREKSLSIQDADTIDSMGIDQTGREVVLTIDDPLDWSERQAHMLALQAKFNGYLAFIQAGRIAVQMPQAAGLRPHIALYLSHEPPPVMASVLEDMGRFAAQKNVSFSFGVRAG